MTKHFNPAAYTAHRDHDPVPNREGFVPYTPISDEEFRTAMFGKRLSLGDTFAEAKKYADEKLAERVS